jgi:SAM-dependent methyltransferase
MKILNPRVLEDLERGVPLKLDVGCGERPSPGYYGVDLVEMNGVDIVADLNKPLDLLPDNSVGAIISRHVLEHIPNLVPLLAEFRRITRPDGRIEIVVPHFSNPYFYSDPTHVRFFGLYTFFYFADPEHQPRRKVPAFYSDVRFRVESIRIDFPRDGLIERLTCPLLKRLVNLSTGAQDWYERRLCRVFTARQIRYVLRPEKATARLAARAA